ncbi:MAG: Rrf2 family transcriptional regulator [Thermoleophilia bacterium]|nr:Rrf2 family transcriptional regulator [Thermoleophilia bacterium]
MEITRRTDYAIRILLALAGLPRDERLSARELGTLQEVPYAFARGILTELAGAGFVTSRRGVGGGVSLARPAEAITLLEVVEAMEGHISLNLCTRDPDYCGRAGGCFMHQIWQEAEQTLRASLASYDFALLAGGRRSPLQAVEPKENLAPTI